MEGRTRHLILKTASPVLFPAILASLRPPIFLLLDLGTFPTWGTFSRSSVTNGITQSTEVHSDKKKAQKMAFHLIGNISTGQSVRIVM